MATNTMNTTRFLPASRDLSVDTLRGLTCVMVVIYHVIGDTPSVGLRVDDGILRNIDNILALVMMPLFAFLAGITYNLRPATGSLKDFIGNKFMRLIVPMLIVATPFAILQVVLMGKPVEELRWMHIKPVALFWFLESLFWIFVVVAMSERAQLLRRPWTFMVMLLIAVALNLNAGNLNFYMGSQGASLLLIYFLLGVGMERFGGERIPFVAAILLAVAAIPVAYRFAVGSTNVTPQYPLAALFIGVVACIFARRMKWDNSALTWLGLHSFAIYLFHIFFVTGSRIAFGAAGLKSKPILFVVGLVLGVFGPILVERVLQQLPFGWLVLGNKAPRQRVSAA